MKIGIVDDRGEDIGRLQALCEAYLKKAQKRHKFYTFLSGEEVLAYCEDEESERLDLLFLDIEMPGMGGIKVQEFSRTSDKIFRVAYATSHEEWMDEAYDCNVIGFLKKPVKKDKVCKVLDKVIREQMRNVQIQLPQMSQKIQMEELEYIKCDKNYVELHICNKGMAQLLTMPMTKVEKELQELPIIRVHRSYMVNLMHVKELGDKIKLKHNIMRIPVGQTYKARVKEQYDAFRTKMVRERME